VEPDYIGYCVFKPIFGLGFSSRSCYCKKRKWRTAEEKRCNFSVFFIVDLGGGAVVVVFSPVWGFSTLNPCVFFSVFLRSFS